MIHGHIHQIEPYAFGAVRGQSCGKYIVFGYRFEALTEQSRREDEPILTKRCSQACLDPEASSSQASSHQQRPQAPYFRTSGK